MGFAGLRRALPSESWRMISEKQAALAHASIAALASAAAGEPALQTTRAMMEPFQERTSGNLKRLRG